MAMIAWINVGILAASLFLTLRFYARSVGLAAAEKIHGANAGAVCGRYRILSAVLMFSMVLNYSLYRAFPLPIPLATDLPWSRQVSLAIALALGVPSVYLMIRGIFDAGRETFLPERGRPLFGGIYRTMRHPQATGALLMWWAIAFLMHSPFLVIASFAYVPAFLFMCSVEEKDLLVRYGTEYEAYRQRVGLFWPKR